MDATQLSVNHLISALTLAQIAVDARALLPQVHAPSAVKLLRRIEAYAEALQIEMDLPAAAGVVLDAIPDTPTRQRIAAMSQSDILAALINHSAVVYPVKEH